MDKDNLIGTVQGRIRDTGEGYPVVLSSEEAKAVSDALEAAQLLVKRQDIYLLTARHEAWSEGMTAGANWAMAGSKRIPTNPHWEDLDAATRDLAAANKTIFPKEA